VKAIVSFLVLANGILLAVPDSNVAATVCVECDDSECTYAALQGSTINPSECEYDKQQCATIQTSGSADVEGGCVNEDPTWCEPEPCTGLWAKKRACVDRDETGCTGIGDNGTWSWGFPPSPTWPDESPGEWGSDAFLIGAHITYSDWSPAHSWEWYAVSGGSGSSGCSWVSNDGEGNCSGCGNNFLVTEVTGTKRIWARKTIQQCKRGVPM